VAGLTTIRQFKDDNTGCWATLTLASREPCWISVARSGVIVKRSVLGLFGAKLYAESDVYRAAITAKALVYVLPGRLLPSGFSNPVLSAFTNAALHCVNSAEVSRVLNEAIGAAERQAGKSISELDVVP
jgi:hypothetical protein